MTLPFSAPDSPFSLFQNWMEDAKQSEPTDPDAACLATVDNQGLPNARVVLIRKVDDAGFCFFTNYDSAKGQEILGAGKAAINFHWKSLKRQVRVRGSIGPVSQQESDDYYLSRPMGNRIGAWASLQSQPLPDRETLVLRAREFEQKFGENPPRPSHWGGFRISPASIEFWQEGESRLHDRVKYEKKGDLWTATRLYP